MPQGSSAVRPTDGLYTTYCLYGMVLDRVMLFNKVMPIFQSISANGLVTIAVCGLRKVPLEKLCRRIMLVSRCGSVFLDEWFRTFQGILVLDS